jgi:glycosyltransferase involved in cell wall biosynthesis
MRIVYVIETLGRGGAEKQLALIARAMKSRDHDVSVIVLFAEGWWAERLRSAGIPVVFLDFPNDYKLRLRMLPAFRRLVRELRQQRPHVVCGFLYRGSLIAALAAHQAGVTRMISVRRDCGFIRDQAPMPRFLERLACGASAMYVANSQAVALALHDEGVPRLKIRIICNGIEIDEGPLRSRRVDGEFRAGLLANLTPQKDHITFVRAIALAIPHCPTLRAVIAGRDYGDRGQAIRAEINRLNLGARVELLPHEDDAIQLISSLDVGVLSSMTEGFPNVLLEYMSQAKPVIASRVGGIPEVVHDGETGLLVTAGDAPALAQSIVQLAHDRTLRERMGRAGLEAVRRHYDIRKIALEWEALYEEISDRSTREAIARHG